MDKLIYSLSSHLLLFLKPSVNSTNVGLALVFSNFEFVVNLCPSRIEGHSEGITSLWVDFVDQVWNAVMNFLVFPECISITILTDRIHFRAIWNNMSHLFLLSLQNLTTAKDAWLLGDETLFSVVVYVIYLQGRRFAVISGTPDESWVEEILINFRYSFRSLELRRTVAHGTLKVQL